MATALTMTGVTIWLLMTTPTAVASAVHGADLLSLVQMIVGTIYEAIVDFVAYFVKL
jgi:phage-related minor tail protein